MFKTYHSNWNKRSIGFSLLFVLMLMLTQNSFGQNLDNLKDKKPFDAGGSIALNTSFYHSNNNNFPFGKTDPFHWNIVGTPWISIYEFQIPFSFSVGKQNASFEHPFYQFGASPSYKWLTVHAGYRNMTFNPYTLNGHTFLGGGVEMNPGKFRFAVMAGRLSDAVEYDTTANVIDEPSYKRFGFGAKVGYGTESNNVDIMFFKAKDKVSSIDEPPYDQKVTPGENLTIGISTKQKIGKYLNWYADLGASLYTRDLVGTDSFYVENNLLEKFDFVFKPNLSSRANLAVKTGLNLRVKQLSLATEYERVAPEYESMGSYFFANDFNRILINPSVSLAKNKVRLNTSYNFQWNNLKDIRLQTTYKSNGVINVDINPKPKFGINLGYSNFYIFQGDGALPLIDSVALNMMTHVATVVPRLTFIKPDLVQTYVLSVNYQTLTDNNTSTEIFTETSSLNLLLNGVFSLVKKKHSINTGLNFLRVDGSFIDNMRYGVSLGFNTRLAEDQLTLRVQSNVSLNHNSGQFNGHSESLNFQLGYSIKKMHSITFNTNLLNNTYKTGNSYFEFRGQVGYIFTLNSIVKDRKTNTNPAEENKGLLLN